MARYVLWLSVFNPALACHHLGGVGASQMTFLIELLLSFMKFMSILTLIVAVNNSRDDLALAAFIIYMVWELFQRYDITGLKK